MLILKSTIVWNRLPSLEEIRSAVDPVGDPTIADYGDFPPEQIREYFDLKIRDYFDLTGLRIFYNGKDRYRSEYKYIVYPKNKAVYLPIVAMPDPEDFILV